MPKPAKKRASSTWGAWDRVRDFKPGCAGLCRAVPVVFWFVKGTSRLKRKQGVNLSAAVETTHGLKLTQGSV